MKKTPLQPKDSKQVNQEKPQSVKTKLESTKNTTDAKALDASAPGDDVKSREVKKGYELEIPDPLPADKLKILPRAESNSNHSGDVRLDPSGGAIPVSTPVFCLEKFMYHMLDSFELFSHPRFF